MDKATLLRLVQNRKAITAEIHTENCFYGHATLLKQRAGVAQHRQLKVGIQHGITYGLDISKDHRNLVMPVFICAGEAYARNYEQELPHKQAVAIGPMISYSTPQPYAVPGKTLLVFPPHSAFSVKAVFDHQAFAERVETIARDYEHVMVSIHWRDVLHDIPQIYMDRGFECVTSGHIFDFDFLHRLSGYIQAADAVYTSSVGSHLLFSILLGKPVWLQFIEYGFESTNQMQLATVRHDYLSYPNVQRIIQLFAEQRDDITSEQRQFVEDLTGAHLVKSGAELREIFDLAEELYQRELTPKRRLLGLARKGLYYQRRIVSAFNGGIVPIPLPED